MQLTVWFLNQYTTILGKNSIKVLNLQDLRTLKMFHVNFFNAVTTFDCFN